MTHVVCRSIPEIKPISDNILAPPTTTTTQRTTTEPTTTTTVFSKYNKCEYISIEYYKIFNWKCNIFLTSHLY